MEENIIECKDYLDFNEKFVDRTFHNNDYDEKEVFDKFIVTENRKIIDLKVFIVNFNNVKNSDKFISTIAKILIMNKYLSIENPESYQELSCVNFSSTYEKSLKSYNRLNQIFELVLEKNENPITAGGFRFQDRLKNFLQDKTRSIDFSKFIETHFFLTLKVSTLKKKYNNQ